ncbi:hypothetical protein CQR55_1039 [Bifidobacterium pseudolongum subsp. globosum]|uniref:hypothetical protein n=1 Tax=Bifidobacterium pseudolongum TaxID=1694 RepID=UPI000C71198D|nr:hypothetical protein [Bifidobacterium pseudolongum]PKU96704.1 hypothetical protein CQR55_1039 [Bifidobacterium pseudolongum subsp. globosum]
MVQWWEIFAAMGGASAMTAIVQHWVDEWKIKHPHEQTPEVKARNVLSRHSGLRILKDIHADAVSRGYVTLDEIEEAQEIYDAYHLLGGNGAGTRIITDLRSMRNYPKTN